MRLQISWKKHLKMVSVVCLVYLLFSLVSKRMLVLLEIKILKKKFNIYFNLQVRDIKGWKKSNEGCLSEPGVRIDVQRPIECTVEYDTLDGRHCVRTLKYLDTRVWCHEADHAKGILLQDIGTFNAEETRLYATGAEIGAIKWF